MPVVRDNNNQKKTFRPRARLLQLLGDQLIRDPRIGVFELVKNAYDADSPSVEVIFENVEDPETAAIKIRDKGEGMDLDTVTDIWLEPGADNREKERTACKRTPRFNRLPIGEKGVGRFASHNLHFALWKKIIDIYVKGTDQAESVRCLQTATSYPGYRCTPCQGLPGAE